MHEIIENPLHLDADSVWVRPDAREFGYTDGLRSERHLERVFRSASDLGVDSSELERGIRDWPSRYHLTRARAQLLKGFGFDRSATVLEVGCGCGAITRYLGETFDRVVSIEGSHARARLARMRTRDLDNVSIVSSPFEELTYRIRFDYVFCIGVFEYAPMFVRGERPFRRILEHFRDLLAPGGVVVLAIENRFGLKYFCSSAEDHNGVMFDGIEGYPRVPNGARTFGYDELRARLEEQFGSTEFFFPFPDYKLPSCVVSGRMLERVDVSELVGSFPTMDYGNPARRPLFSEQLAWSAIARERTIPRFSHSFLVFAGADPPARVEADWLAIAYSGRRRDEFRTETRFVDGPDGTVRVRKTRLAGDGVRRHEELEHREWSGDWIEGPSLQMVMARQARTRGLTLEEAFEPVRPWFDFLARQSDRDDGRRTVPGTALDSIWRNCYIREGAIEMVDQEWAWVTRLPFRLIVARGFYYFAQSLLGANGLGPAFRRRRIHRIVRSGAAAHGVRLGLRDMLDLARFEARLLRLSTPPSAADADRSGWMGAWDVIMVMMRKLDPAPRGGVGALARRVLRRLKRVVKRAIRR